MGARVPVYIFLGLSLAQVIFYFLYFFKLQAKDNGIDGRVIYVELFINIESINEYPPKFNRDLYLFDLNENSAFNTTVGYVQAYDDDLKHSQLFGNFYYTLKNGQNRFEKCLP
jgi:hypothetical protein